MGALTRKPGTPFGSCLKNCLSSCQQPRHPGCEWKTPAQRGGERRRCWLQGWGEWTQQNNDPLPNFQSDPGFTVNPLVYLYSMSCTHPAFLISTPIEDCRLKVKLSALGRVLADLSSLLTQPTSQTIISKQITGWTPSAPDSGSCCPALGGPSHGSVRPVLSSPPTSPLSMTGSGKLILGTASSDPALLTSVLPSAFT